VQRLEDQILDRPTNLHPIAAVVLGLEPEHCLQEVGPVPLEEVPEHFRTPKRDRLMVEEGPAVVEGTFVADGVAEEALERMDCWVDSTQPMLPSPDLPEGVVEGVAVHFRVA